LKSRVQRADCVIIHGTYSLSATLIARFARIHSVPFVVIPHGGLDPWVFSYRSLRKRIWLKIFSKELLTAPDLLIFATELERKKAKHLVSRSRSVVINWPVTLPEIAGKADSAVRVRQRFNLLPNARILLFCGRIHPMKRVLETVRAFAAARPIGWIMLLVGPFTEEISHEKLTEACAAGGAQIVIAGPQFGRDLDDCYAGATAFVSFSWRENFGYTVPEASSFGLPVLISRGIDLHSEVLRRGAGRLCEDEKEQGMERAIVEFCTLPDAELAAMGERGRRWVEEELSPAQFAGSLNSVFQRVTNSNARVGRDLCRYQSEDVV
jgi:glycosyltransferase involved in cell wall biosynthesis